MKCDKCNGIIVDGCCTRCGTLINNEKIKDKVIDKNEDLKLFNDDFDIINKNKNLLLIFILGPLYFSYRGFLLLGIIMGLIDYYLFYTFISIESFAMFFIGTSYVAFLYFFITRLFYIIFSNYICLLIDKIKVRRIKNKYKEKYKEKLSKYKHHKYYLLINILIYAILLIIFIISRRIKNGTI